MPALTVAPTRALRRSAPMPPGWWWGFILFDVVAVVHIIALIAHDSSVGPSKLLLMPALAAAVVWAARESRWRAPHVLLLAAIGLSWLGDGAASFFPFAPTLPVMLLCFGLAHLAYIWLFTRDSARTRVPWWAALYGVWWIVLIVLLWPRLGTLALAVAAYGLVLAGTAITAARCHPLTAIGGALFLSSDTLLALLLFTPEIVPPFTDTLVMITYCLGQALIAAGVLMGGLAAKKV